MEKTGGDLPEYIGKYEILGRLGTGGMAEVFLARRSGAAGFEKKVALKRLATHKLEDEVLIRSLINEARLVSQLSHQNLVQVLEFELIERAYCMVMEYVEGMTLETVLDRCANAGVYLPSGLVIYIALEVCAGLDYAHHATTEEGAPLHLVHRDIKPSNVMISRRGQVKLMDFGIAKASTNAYKTTAHGGVKGTLAYMSPEQLSGEADMGPASDLYSFGLILYELATLQRLYDDSNLFKLASSMQEGLNKEARERLTACFPELVDIVSRLLNFYPDQRYPDARSLMYELRPLLFHAGALELAEFLKDLSSGHVGGAHDKTLASLGNLHNQIPVIPQGSMPEQRQKAQAAGSPWQDPSSGMLARSRDASLPPPARGSTEALPSEAIMAFGSSVSLPSNGSRQDLSSVKGPGAELGANGNSGVSLKERVIPRGSESTAESLVPTATAYSRRHLVASALTGGAVVVAILVWLGTRAPEPTTGEPEALTVLQVGDPVAAPAPSGAAPGVGEVANPVGGAPPAVTGEGPASVDATASSAVASSAMPTVAKDTPKGGGAGGISEPKSRPARTPPPKEGSKKPASGSPTGSSLGETRSSEAATAVAPVASTGTIRIASQPWAEVYVDGKKVGEVPLKAELPTGSHQVKLVTTDGAEKSFPIIVKPGEEVRKGWSFKENQWLEF